MRPPTHREIDLARSLYPGAGWADGHVDEGGSEHLVLVAAPVAVLRIARSDRAARDLPRRVAVVEALAARLPFELPVPLSKVEQRGPMTAVVQRFVPGSTHPFGSGDPGRLRALLRQLEAVDTDPVRSMLAEPFDYVGPWTEHRRERTLAVLPAHLRSIAVDVLAAVGSYADQPPGLVHGDLAGDNMRWVDGELAGVLDWDRAAAWDPAINLAHLSIWHGADLIGQLTDDPEKARRAIVWGAAQSLERVDHLATRTDTPDSDRLLRKIEPRLRRAGAVLSRPGH
ncbi:phosphotransferase family protein [Blastococcus sp. Marseille-P5729]|uniref:phosphotransferase family protein n=1 Tax=Blastococcus sp. Marseille-P5729 TaxID=2086582 RepID=UPI000D114808|nr:phosphotransferase [Blastococcus sp. Marseille-P5729]